MKNQVDTVGEVYEFRDGYSYKADPAAVGRELKRLKEVSGLDEEDERHIDVVISAARDKRSPLHSCFNWDKEAAFQRDLRRQARSLIKAVHVTYLNDGVPVKVPLFVYVPGGEGKKSDYQLTRLVVQQEDILEAAVRKMTNFIDSAADELDRVLELAGKGQKYARRGAAMRRVRANLLATKSSIESLVGEKGPGKKSA